MEQTLKYQKIPAVYRRENVKPHRVLVGEYTSRELELLKDVKWSFTEKVDGTNIRVMWDGHKVTFGGRTDNAQIPAKLVTWLNDTFSGEATAQIFEEEFGESPAVLYGEGYGAGIQSGGNYAPDQKFVLFDVRIGTTWLPRVAVEVTAARFDIDVVPELFIDTLDEGIATVRTGLMSSWGNFEAEGLVGRPLVDLFNQRGERIIVKIKADDFCG